MSFYRDRTEIDKVLTFYLIIEFFLSCAYRNPGYGNRGYVI